MPKKQFTRWIIIIICLYLIVTTTQSIVDLLRAGDKQAEREKRVTTLKEEQEELLRQKAAAANPTFLEKMARDQLELSKPGEEIIIIPQDLLVDRRPVATPDATPNWQKWVKVVF